MQVNLLGYLGPIATPFIDYLIADPVVVPAACQPLYPERIVHLPHCYLPLDTRGRVIAADPSRAVWGPPAQGFVFCNFSAACKLTPALFAIWLRLLAGVPGSVLWLHDSNPTVRANLAATAAAGIDPRRLMFGATLSQPEYLVRRSAADLFLDTLPCAARITGVDALWASPPIITCAGGVFSGHHAASPLQAAGLPELVTHSLADYEATALRLASEPSFLVDLQARLARREGPLFDVAGYIAALETIYQRVVERAD